MTVFPHPVSDGVTAGDSAVPDYTLRESAAEIANPGDSVLPISPDSIPVADGASVGDTVLPISPDNISVSDGAQAGEAFLESVTGAAVDHARRLIRRYFRRRR